MGRQRDEAADRGYTYEQPSDIVRLNKFYITCQVDEDLAYIMQSTGEDHLIVGSDYTHADASGEMDFARLLQERADRGDIPQSAVQKIAYDNGRALYGL
jgi:predicted TIM-barrel fold metal-dependent hydrolase